MSKDRDQSGIANVLVHRVIALNGTFDSTKQSPDPTEGSPPLFQRQPLDLAATALEWGARCSAKVQPTAGTETAAERPSAPGAQSTKDSADAQWATYSSISMRPYDEALLSQSILSANIEDAATAQYHPTAPAPAATVAAPNTELASLDRALESAGVLQNSGVKLQLPAPAAPKPVVPEASQARVFVVPAALVWAVLGGFAVCALALAYLVAVFLM